MPRNQKLTKIIGGRTVKVATVEPGGVLVLFDDQSNMKIKTAGPATIPPGGKVKSIHVPAVESKPASDGRIKTSHFFTFKSVGDVLARNDLTVSERFGGKVWF